MKENKFHQIQDAYPLLKNKEKYNGTRPLSLRSGWEISFVFKYLDVNINIISWTSESKIIKYIGPDNNSHRYFMDFSFVAKTQSGETKEIWVEIKPHSQTLPPKVPQRKTKNYIYQVNEYLKNQCKWTTTKKIVEEKKAQGQNLDFVIITERDCPFFLKG